MGTATTPVLTWMPQPGVPDLTCLLQIVCDTHVEGPMKIYLSAAENAIHHCAGGNGWNWSPALIAYSFWSSLQWEPRGLAPNWFRCC